jgi:hypothetical protein
MLATSALGSTPPGRLRSLRGVAWSFHAVLRMPLFSRRDGTLCRDVPAYRQIMPFIMRTRNESAVCFSQTLNLDRTMPWLEEQSARLGTRCTLFHVFLYGVLQVLEQRPRLNRFVAGGRLYQRKGIWVSYSAKKALRDDAPIVVLKREFSPQHTFTELMAALAGDLKTGRSDEKSHVDKELRLVLALPGPIIRLLLRLQTGLYDWNLLPDAYTRPDPMYASMFIANLGSLKMDAAYHHLYEYGNIPIFAVVGRVHRAVQADHDGNAVTRTVAQVKYTLDERTEDGLYCAQSLEVVRQVVEDPATHVKV